VLMSFGQFPIGLILVERADLETLGLNSVAPNVSTN